MFALGIQGSPRKQGNSSTLLATFLAEAKRIGAETLCLEVGTKKINPCIGCENCVRTGFCVQDDEMRDVYPLLWKADALVVATPVFFYSVPAQLKALIDRCQTLWARKYIHKLNDPGHKWRQGYLLAVGATKGKNLFEGIALTMKYFFDAIGSRYSDQLTFTKIETLGAIEKHPTAISEAQEKARLWLEPFLQRKKILFLCRENSCRSQMAQGFARWYGGDNVEAESAGSTPAEKVNELMVEVMKEKGIDMAFRQPKASSCLAASFKPDRIITMGCQDACPVFPGASYQDWNLPDPAHQPIEVMRTVRNEIEKRVKDLLKIV